MLLGAYYDGFEPLAVVGEPAYTSSGKNVAGCPGHVRVCREYSGILSEVTDSDGLRSAHSRGRAAGCSSAHHADILSWRRVAPLVLGSQWLRSLHVAYC